MKTQNTEITLSTSELEVISDLLENTYSSLRNNYNKYKEGASLMESTNYGT